MNKLILFSLAFISFFSQADSELAKPIAVSESAKYQMKVLVNSSYIDAQGRMVLDVLEGSSNYLALSAETNEGQPVLGLQPEFKLIGSSHLMPATEAAPLNGTDENGIMEFGLVAGTKGLDSLTLSYGDNSVDLHFNIISLNISSFPELPETGIKWGDLMDASLDYQEGTLVASFTSPIMKQAGETIEISGFMLPLDPDTKQRHFLLVSSPPSCFYHFPGGPAGVVEVFSEDGIEASWAPVNLTGKLVLVEKSETGIIYQLEQAEITE